MLPILANQRIIVCTVIDNPSATWVSARAPHKDAQSSDTFQVALGWLSECQEDHAACQREIETHGTSRYRPTRLIDVQCEDTNTIRLDERSTATADTDGACAAGYLALSYCWGGDQAGKTLRANVEGRTLQSFSLSEQPKSIRDAVEVTRNLVYRYVWIDSLCIIQDDDEDKQRELGQMHLVYQNAELTISAANSASSHDGFLQVCRGNPRTRIKYRGPDGVLGSVIATRAQGMTEPIHNRGWTLQEHLLARRLLIFGTFGMRWVCQSARKVDGVQEDEKVSRSELSERIDSTGNPTTGALDWREIVGIFRSRLLTAQADRLPALGAIAAVFASRMRGRYLAGLWEDSFFSDLLWETGDITHPEPQLVVSKRDQGGEFPTWSWASISAPIHYLDDDDESPQVTAQLLRAEVVPLSSVAPFGHVTWGRITLRGHLAAVVCRCTGQEAWDAEDSPKMWFQMNPNVARLALLAPRVREEVSDTAGRDAGPVAGAVLDTDMLASGLDAIYCLEILGCGFNDDGLRDDQEPRVYSTGLVLRALDLAAFIFSRVGIYRVGDGYDEEGGVSQNNVHRRTSLKAWIGTKDAVTVHIV